MSIKTPVKSDYKALKPFHLQAQTHEVGAIVPLYPKQAVFLLSSGVIETVKPKKEAKK